MKTDSRTKGVETEKTIEGLEELRTFSGTPGEFWSRFVKGCTLLTEADMGTLLLRDKNSLEWKTFVVWPSKSPPKAEGPEFTSRIAEFAEVIAEYGSGLRDMPHGPAGISQGILMGVKLDVGEVERLCVGIFYTRKNPETFSEDILLRLRLAADIPLVYQTRRIADQAKSDVVRFVEALDVMVLLNAEKRYMAAAMAFCNEIASRFGCSRASLGWLKDGYIRLQAISHMEKFEKKMDAVQNLEAAMEESFDQDEEIIYPKPEGNSAVMRDHEAFALEHGIHYMASLPLRLDGDPAGVITCERESNAFSENDINGLRLLCDQASRRLGDLKKHDRWFGAKLTEYLRDGLGKLIGVKHTFAKAVGILVSLILAFLIFGTWQYRVEAPFILKTDDLAYLPAPFDGYINKVYIRAGDQVKENDLLLNLDTSELFLEESSAIADLARYAGEAEKARAKNALAEMKIALAMKAQAEARLELIRYHLANAELKSPFSGVVVEGDLKELQGAPVRKGDVLFKVARIEKMYAELDINERDVHEVATERNGEIAFVSMPNEKFPIKVEVINPVAVAKKDGNVFLTRCLFTEKAEAWWRPGMSGIAKIEVGKRTILWIITHRTINFFRLLLWV